MIELKHGDSLQAMKGYGDGHFDWSIVDPPYFSGPDKLGYYGERVSSNGIKRPQYKEIGTWSIPDMSYYNELLRVSKNQIIWGINYFEFAGMVKGRIVWDKCNDTSSFSDCEIASCSSIEVIRQFRFMWNGMLQGKSVNAGHIMQGNKKLNEKRIHPTQKPVKLYKWLLDRFTKENDLILDTHLGSGSIAIACHQMKRRLIGYEIDKGYYDAACKRFKAETAQLTLL